MIYSLVEISKDSKLDAFIDGLLPALVCIIVVFLILALITLIVSGINKLKFLDDEEVESIIKNEIEDDDMLAAVLVATIDYREEVKTDVKLVRVRRID